MNASNMKSKKNPSQILPKWCLALFFLRNLFFNDNQSSLQMISKAHAAAQSASPKHFVPSRDRVVKARYERGNYNRFRDNGRPIEGPNYRHLKTFGGTPRSSGDSGRERRGDTSNNPNTLQEPKNLGYSDTMSYTTNNSSIHRRAGQLTSCCSNYVSYSASNLCSLYNQDCTSGKTKSHDGEDQSCTQEGLSFIGISFSVLTNNGNPYSYQLCDQFPMEKLIDRDYDYVMSMDEDGWLVGGGYKQFDYSGKMPYIDSSHTELLRIGSLDVSKGGTSIQQVYKAMSSVVFEPFPIYPEYLKSGGGKKNNNNGNSGSAPSGDITLIVSVVEVYSANATYSSYETFITNLFSALQNVSKGDCVDDHDTDPHVSMARGVKFKSSYHMQQYANAANLEVAVWQAMYPYGVIIGSSSSASFPPGVKGKKQAVGYGNMYFFFDRMNITKAFPPSRGLTDDEFFYATLYKKGKASKFYGTVNATANYNHEGGNDSWEYNPYQWKTNMAIHDQTNGWDLPPNCNEEGETFVGVALSRKSTSNLQSTSTFQEQFDFEYLLDRNFTYIMSFGTNHGWLVGGEQEGNGAGSLVDKDTAHIPLFYLGTTNPNMGGMALSDMIKVLKTVQFGTLYIKPAFVFTDSNGHLKLQFEADPYSSMGYLYDNLCQMLGVKWNYVSPYNSHGLYTNCAMHAAGDRATYGCGPTGANSGGFCPQMTLAYSPRFRSQNDAASYITSANNYVDYWRSLYPYGVAVGTNTFCRDKTSSSGYKGGCLGLFLNRMDLYYVFAPDLSGAWVQFNGNSIAPTSSPAPTYAGGCDDPRNFHLDKCFKVQYTRKSSSKAATYWSSLGRVGQLSFIAMCSMTTFMIAALIISRIRKQKRRTLKSLLRQQKRKKRGDRLESIRDTSDVPKDVNLDRNSSRVSTLSGSRSRSIRGKLLSEKRGTKDHPMGGNHKSSNYEPPHLQASHSGLSDFIQFSRSRTDESRGATNRQHTASQRLPVSADQPPNFFNAPLSAQSLQQPNGEETTQDPTDRPNFFLT